MHEHVAVLLTSSGYFCYFTWFVKMDLRTIFLILMLQAYPRGSCWRCSGCCGCCQHPTEALLFWGSQIYLTPPEASIGDAIQERACPYHTIKEILLNEI